MKLRIVFFIGISLLLLTGLSFVVKQAANQPPTEQQDAIVYLPIVPTSNNRLVVEATVDGGKSGYFALDSGGSSKLLIDSAFFYKNVDTSGLVEVRPRGKMYYWHTYYEGNVNVSIGYHSFNVSHIEVREWLPVHDGSNIVGIIGEEPFLDKITVINFQENKIAFVDSLQIDSSYHAIPFLRYAGLVEGAKNQRFISIGGFSDKKGNKKSGKFSFDTGNGLTGVLLQSSFADDLDLSTKRVDDLKETSFLRWEEDLIIGNDLLATKVPVRRYRKDAVDIFSEHKESNGLIGMPLLKRYNIIADYKNDVLYLKPINIFYQE